MHIHNLLIKVFVYSWITTLRSDTGELEMFGRLL